MRTRTPTDKTPQSEEKPLDPRVFKDNRIDAMEIYGMREFVEGKTSELEDHPDFPNPRSAWNMDRGIVEEIAHSGELLEPVKLYWTAKNEVVLIDGKTRMTGIGLYLKQRPNLIGKLEVPIQRVRDTETNIQLLMLKYNLLESKRPLTEVDVSRYLRKLNNQGVVKEEMLKVLDKSGRRGLIWLNHMMQIIDANPVAVEAYEKGEIDFTTAKMIAKQEFGDQPRMLDTIKLLKKELPAANEAQIRKLAGVKKANRVTLGFDPTFDYLFDQIYLPGDAALDYAADMERRFGILSRRVRSWLKKEGVLEEYEEMQKVEELRHTFQVFMFFLKQSGASIEDQRLFVESQLSEEQQLALARAREERGAPVKRPKRDASGKKIVRVT